MMKFSAAILIVSAVQAIKLDRVVDQDSRKLMGMKMMKKDPTDDASGDTPTMPPTAENGKLSFAFLGDGPYGADGVVPWEYMIADVNSDSDIQFVVHTGDCKAGSELCSDELISSRFDLYQGFNAPFVYTIGDNEWSDCHRENNGAYNPLERLSFVRKVFFPVPGQTTGGTNMTVESQANVMPGFETYVEHVMFTMANVVFATLHVTGSNNDLRPWSGIDPEDSYEIPRQDRIDEFNDRVNATLHWMDYVFETASTNDNAGIFIAIQANMGFETSYLEQDRLGFNPILERMLPLAKKFNKPVVLGHGDDHYFLVNRPRSVASESNPDSTSEDDNIQIPFFTRVMGWGDVENFWIKITVDPSDPNLFSFSPRMVAANLPASNTTYLPWANATPIFE